MKNSLQISVKCTYKDTDDLTNPKKTSTEKLYNYANYSKHTNLT